VGPKIDEINEKGNQDFGSTLKEAAGEDVSSSHLRYLLTKFSLDIG
jgi:hypothetical protein